MIITCPACATQFRVPDGALGSNGRKLRCSSCRHVWFQEPIAPPLDETPLEDTPAAEPAAQTPPAPSPAPIEEPVTATEAATVLAEPPAAEAEAPQSPPSPAEEPLAPTVSEPEAGLPEAEEESAAEAPAEEASPEPESAAGPDSVSEPPAAESEEPAPVTPSKVGTTGWEPGAVMPRSVKPEPTPQSPQTPRGSLRLVGKEPDATSATTPSGAQNARPATPAFDVTRVVTPDSAPAEAKTPPRRKRRSGLILVLLLLVAVVAGAYFERNQVMRFVPQTAQFYRMVGLLGAPSAQGLQLLDVAYRVEEVGGTPSLIVSGKVMNVGRDFHLIPELRVMLLDEEGNTTESWALRTTAEGLAPGAVTVFEAVYTDPPRTGQDKNIVLVFADRI